MKLSHIIPPLLLIALLAFIIDLFNGQYTYTFNKAYAIALDIYSIVSFIIDITKHFL